MEELRFSQKPYYVAFKDFHTGEMKRELRRPPPKLHPILPTDRVELTVRKNEDWPEDTEYTVKHISYRAPNTLQIENKNGDSTFVPYTEVQLTQELAYREGDEKRAQASSRYLSWP